MTKIGRRRNRNEGVQWLMIGIVLGMACSFTLGFAGYVFGLIELSSSEGERETIIVTSTVDPAALTLAVTPETPPSIIQTPSDETEPTEEQVQAPIATFTPTNLPDGSPTDEGNVGGAPTQGVGTPPPTGILPGPPTQDTSVLLAIGATTLLTVDGGSFTMGTDEAEGLAAVADCVQLFGGTCTDAMILDSMPFHQVTLDSFQIEQFEVSVIQYVNYLNYLVQQNPGTRPHLTACGGACALTAQDTGGEASDISYDAETQQYTVRLAGVDRANYPVTLVTWFGAEAYCKALGRFLPTEAQWERAARGLPNNIYPWGPQWNEALAKTDRPVEDGTVPVDSYPDGTSSFGAFNMSGNVAEWTADFYSANYYSQADAGGPNPRGPSSGDKKVVRGGSWSTPPIFARAVHRVDGFGPGDVSTWVGFRCADDGIGGSAVAPTTNGTPNTTSNTSNTTTNPTPDTAASNPSGLGDKTGSGSGTNPNTTPINNPPVNIPPTATLADGQ